jgi:hypothetical protein
VFVAVMLLCYDCDASEDLVSLAEILYYFCRVY